LSTHPSSTCPRAQYIARFTDDTTGEFLVAKTGGDVGERQVRGLVVVTAGAVAAAAAAVVLVVVVATGDVTV